MRKSFHSLLSTTLLILAAGTVHCAPGTEAAITSATLTVTKSGFGTGAGKASGIDGGSTCSDSYKAGAMVSLTPVPDDGSVFTGWSGACKGTGPCKVTLNANEPVDAIFDTPTAALAPAAFCSNLLNFVCDDYIHS